jgi:hypothetical protein
MTELTKDQIMITLVVSVAESEEIVSALEKVSASLSAHIKSQTTPQEAAQRLAYADTGAIAPQD